MDKRAATATSEKDVDSPHWLVRQRLQSLVFCELRSLGCRAALIKEGSLWTSEAVQHLLRIVSAPDRGRPRTDINPLSRCCNRAEIPAIRRRCKIRQGSNSHSAGPWGRFERRDGADRGELADSIQKLLNVPRSEGLYRPLAANDWGWSVHRTRRQPLFSTRKSIMARAFAGRLLRLA